MGDFEILGGKHSEGSSVGPEINLELRERSGEALFFKSAAQACMKMVQKIFLYWVILKKAENILKIRFSHSNLVKIADFRKSTETPLEWSQTTFVNCKCVWKASLWCWEGSTVVFSLYGDTFFWALLFSMHMYGNFEIFGRKHWVRGLQKLPWPFHLIENLSETLPNDVWQTPGWFSLHLKAFCIDNFYLLCIYRRFWDFGGGNT